MRLQSLIAIVLLVIPLFASSQSTPSANPFNDLLMMQINWDASKSGDNAKPSPTLRFTPYEKHPQDGKSFTSYYVYAPGVATGRPYRLIQWQIGWDQQMPPFQPSFDNRELYVNSRGVLMCQKPTATEMNQEPQDLASDASVNLVMAGSMGEPVRFALIDDAKNIVAMGRLIINPIQGDDKSCHLQAILAIGGGEIMLVEGTGFAPKTEVEISSAASGKPQSAKFKTDDSGRVETAVVLMKQGQLHGTATIAMKSDSCAPSVTFPWGHDTYHVK